MTVQNCTKWNTARFGTTQSVPWSLIIISKQPFATSRGINIQLRKIMIVFKLLILLLPIITGIIIMTPWAEKLLLFFFFHLFVFSETRKPCLSICFWSLYNWKSLGKAWAMASKPWIPAFWYEMLSVLELSLPFDILYKKYKE